MLLASSLLVVLPLVPAPQTGPEDPFQQFDFWIGEWAVQNRDLVQDENGARWVDGDLTRARITPVLGGKAILEEWAGPLRGNFMNGFSLRAYDPEAQHWSLLLFWTLDGNGGFGRSSGNFRHGRGEFFTTTQGPKRTRYSFSDALPDTVRWDSAETVDGGVTWKTDWIMEFARTRAAAEVNQDRLFSEDWTQGELSPHPEARELDWYLGRWYGTLMGDDGLEQEARLRCRLLNQDCLVLDVLETRRPGEEDWTESLQVRGYVSGAGRWEAWGLGEADTRMRRTLGRRDDKTWIFEASAPDGSLIEQEVLILQRERYLHIERSRVDPASGELRLMETIELVRTSHR